MKMEAIIDLMHGISLFTVQLDKNTKFRKNNKRSI